MENILENSLNNEWNDERERILRKICIFFAIINVKFLIKENRHRLEISSFFLLFTRFCMFFQPAWSSLSFISSYYRHTVISKNEYENIIYTDTSIYPFIHYVCNIISTLTNIHVFMHFFSRFLFTVCLEQKNIINLTNDLHYTYVEKPHKFTSHMNGWKSRQFCFCFISLRWNIKWEKIVIWFCINVHEKSRKK